MTKNWPSLTLDQLCLFKGGGTPSKAVGRYWQGDIPWVSPKDMKSEIIGDSIDHISAEAIKDSATSLIAEGSILIVVRSGILARTIPISIAGRELTINQDLKALCPKKGIGSRFLYYFLQSQSELLLSMVTTGATVHRLMTDQLRSLNLALPPPPRTATHRRHSRRGVRPHRHRQSQRRKEPPKRPGPDPANVHGNSGPAGSARLGDDDRC